MGICWRPRSRAVWRNNSGETAPVAFRAAVTAALHHEVTLTSAGSSRPAAGAPVVVPLVLAVGQLEPRVDGHPQLVVVTVS